MAARIDTLEKLRAVVAADVSEHERLDFKKTIDHTDHWELAKDVAGFANAYGGVILIGVDETRGDQPVTIFGITKADARQAELAYENAVRDKVTPRAVASSDTIEISEELAVVAVHIEPYINGLVGVRVRGLSGKGKELPSGVAWRFPIRKGKHHVDHSPDQLPFYADPALRRMIVLLERAIVECIGKETLFLSVQNEKSPKANVLVSVGDRVIDHEGNSLNVSVFQMDDSGAQVGPLQVRIALDRIVNIFRATDQRWHIEILGQVGKISSDMALFLPRANY